MADLQVIPVENAGVIKDGILAPEPFTRVPAWKCMFIGTDGETVSATFS